jgi:hypothetical protein
MDDYYKILGLPKGASQRQIKEAYRELAKRYHPDHDANLEWIMQQINEAYSVLSDPQKRRQYDSGNYSEQSESSSQSSESSEEQPHGEKHEEYTYYDNRAEEEKEDELRRIREQLAQERARRRRAWFKDILNPDSYDKFRVLSFFYFAPSTGFWILLGARAAPLIVSANFAMSIVAFACGHPKVALAWPLIYGLSYVAIALATGAAITGSLTQFPLLISVIMTFIFAWMNVSEVLDRHS